MAIRVTPGQPGCRGHRFRPALRLGERAGRPNPARRSPRSTSRDSIPTGFLGQRSVRREHRQRAGGRARPRLVVSAPGSRRRPMGWRNRPLQDGTPVKGDDNFTVHCPAGRDLLRRVRLLGSGYGLDGIGVADLSGGRLHPRRGSLRRDRRKRAGFLDRATKAGRRPRGQSRVVGMYCHAMATLALCEALCTHRR